MRPIILAALLTALALTGCGGDHDHDHKHDHDHDHGHHHAAPHGGTLVVVGQEAAHLEFVLEADTGKLTAYVLGAHAEKGIRIEQPAISLEVALPDGKKGMAILEAQAVELTGEKPGDTSVFAGTLPLLKGASKFEATLVKVTIKGVTFDQVKFPFPEGNEATAHGKKGGEKDDHEGHDHDDHEGHDHGDEGGKDGGDGDGDHGKAPAK